MQYAPGEAKAWARESLRDYFVTTTMPFNDDLSIDEVGLRANVRHILGQASTGGVYVGSIYQEFTSLTLAERKRVSEVVLEEVSGRTPVMVGVSANCVDDVVELADHAQENGADLVMVWPPTFGLRTPTGVLEFYSRIARRVRIGMCLYASGFGDMGFRLTPDMMLALSEIDLVCAVKEASLSLGTYFETLQKVGDRIVVSMPAEEYWLAGRRVMGAGLASNVLLGTSRPLYCETDRRQLCSTFLDAVRSDDHAAATEAMLMIRKVADEVFVKTSQGSHEVGLMKTVTELLGMAGGPVRPPLSLGTPEQAALTRAALAAADLIADDLPVHGPAPELVTTST
jgi:4-hydroxy-tetrahydrodipicolinate synthase